MGWKDYTRNNNFVIQTTLQKKIEIEKSYKNLGQQRLKIPCKKCKQGQISPAYQTGTASFPKSIVKLDKNLPPNFEFNVKYCNDLSKVIITCTRCNRKTAMLQADFLFKYGGEI